ncbi:MAG: hypothetical protein Q8865_08555 [Bacillota bacterium]|nr:hypothetical protein [Bacillota bacterium]
MPAHAGGKQVAAEGRKRSPKVMPRTIMNRNSSFAKEKWFIFYPPK